MADTPTTGHLLRRGATVVRREVALHPRPFALAVLGAAVYGLATAASSWVIGRVVDRIVIPRFEAGEVPAASVALGVLAIVLVGLVKAGGIVFRRTLATIAKTRIDADLRRQVVRHYQRLPYVYHRTQPTGELLAHASADCEAATEVLAPLPFATGVVVMLVATATWLVLTDPYLAAIGLVLLPALVVLNAVYERRVEAPATLAQQQVGEVSAVAHESFDGALVVKALGGEEAESARFRAAAERLRDAKIRVASVRATFDALLDAMPALGIVALVVVGAWRIDAGAMTTGTLVGLVSLFTLLTWPLRLFGYVLGELPRSVVGWDRVQRVLATPVPEVSTGGRRLPPAAPALEVADLWFGYEPGTAVVRGVSFRLGPGSTVALVGPTGSGKSTLLLLLARLIRPDAGRIALSGVDLADLDPAEVAAGCTMAFQEPFLFGASIEENVLLGAEAGPGALDRALRLAGAHEFVAALPEGAASVVGERGATLSGGQRQRIALARALARGPRLLLLDDATSSVDPSTEGRILTGLGRHLTGTTTVVVATRPSTIALADHVLYLEHGRLAGAGSHDELLATVPGYQQLVTAYEQERAVGA